MRVSWLRARPLLACVAALLVGSGLLVGCGARAQQGDLVQYVNPLVGTSGGGNTFPGADVPFGMVQWSPDTGNGNSPGGYQYSAHSIRGFSLTHLSGAGCSTYGDVPILPTTSAPASDPAGLLAGFSHGQEQASPGYYAVTLDSGVQAALTVTQRTGMGQFTFPSGSAPTLLIKAGSSANRDRQAQVTVVGDDEVDGQASSGSFCGAGDIYTVYFAAQFSQPFQSFGTWQGGLIEARMRQAAGPGCGAWVGFAGSTRTVLMKVGLSFVSVAGAQANLRAEDPGWNFEAVRNRARQTWERALGAIQVSGGSASDLRTFYTALYHALLQPNVFSDANGAYIGFDGRVHQAKGYTQYANFSGWDIYRSEVPLLALLDPRQTSDMMQSLVADAEQGGWLPKWPLANGYTGVMNGDSADPIIAGAYAFGARQFDTRAALAAMVKGATQSANGGYVERPGLAGYLALGYVPGKAATTLEYNTDDFSIAQFASALGDQKTEQAFMRRAQGWQLLVDPVTGFLVPRAADGSLPANFDPLSQAGYREGDAWQYLWMVPFNLRGLFSSLGGPAAVLPRLDTFVTQLNAGPQAPYYWAGNEPGLEIPWEYDFLGAPQQTTAVVRSVLSQLYNPGPGGIPGNDDLGEMSSWYVWAALGMYPEIPGVADLVLSAPLFPETVLHLGDGHTVRIQAPGASDRVGYITAARLNGRAYAKPWVPLSRLSSGGQLSFTLASGGNKVESLYQLGGASGPLGLPPAGDTWGTATADAPPSFGAGTRTALPLATPGALTVSAGGHGLVQVGLDNLGATALTATWSLTLPQGLSASPAEGRLTVAAGQKALTPLTIQGGSSARDGVYPAQVTLSAGTHRWEAGFQIVVAPPGSLLSLVNSVAVSTNADPSAADADGDGFSYSAEALAQAGVIPGATISAQGLTFTWPNVPAGLPDNVQAAGQTIRLTPAGHPTVLGLLGMATNGPVEGTASIRYTDGSVQDFTLAMSDWTLNAGGGALVGGDQVAIRTPYRNSSSGVADHTATMVFVQTVPLEAGKTVRSLTLPPAGGSGAIHIFAVALGG